MIVYIIYSVDKAKSIHLQDLQIISPHSILYISHNYSSENLVPFVSLLITFWSIIYWFCKEKLPTGHSCKCKVNHPAILSSNLSSDAITSI